MAEATVGMGLLEGLKESMLEQYDQGLRHGFEMAIRTLEAVALADPSYQNSVDTLRSIPEELFQRPQPKENPSG